MKKARSYTWGTNWGTGGFRDGSEAGEGYRQCPSRRLQQTSGTFPGSKYHRNTVAASVPDPAGELTALPSWICEGRLAAQGEGKARKEQKSRKGGKC